MFQSNEGPLHKPSLDSTENVEPLSNADEILIEKLIKNLNESDAIIQTKVEALEKIDITIQIITYKLYEATHDFKVRIAEVIEERNRILKSFENKSELSLILHDLDQKISDLEKELNERLINLKQEKIEYQQQAETLLFQLDGDTSLMQDHLKELKDEVEVTMGKMYKTQVLLLNKKYAPMLNQLEEHMQNYEKLKLTGWKVEHSDVKLSEILEENGLKFTPSGRLLTRTGSLITFQEAQEKGYFKEITHSLDKIFKFFKERDQQQQAFDQIGSPDLPSYNEGEALEGKVSTEDVKYLKQHVGKALTLALAEITEKQPRDPIHYLGHFLFKYRYNQELEETQKKDLEELAEQRKVVAKERWKRFIEEEAKNAVLDLILRTEQTIYENELKRIELEQMLAEEEEENQEMNELLEEARDKFE